MDFSKPIYLETDPNPCVSKMKIPQNKIIKKKKLKDFINDHKSNKNYYTNTESDIIDINELKNKILNSNNSKSKDYRNSKLYYLK